jgi:hypothetical protein
LNKSRHTVEKAWAGIAGYLDSRFLRCQEIGLAGKLWFYPGARDPRLDQQFEYMASFLMPRASKGQIQTKLLTQSTGQYPRRDVLLINPFGKQDDPVRIQMEIQLSQLYLLRLGQNRIPTGPQRRGFFGFAS